jgi:cobalt/nickel transport system permease protein
MTHFDAFDRYHHAESLIHRLDPRLKVVASAGFIVSNALLPDGAWPAFLVSWLVLLIANDLSALGLGFTFRRSVLALPFALAAVSAIFSPQGHPLAEWHFLGLSLVPTDVGVIRFLSVLTRSWLSVQMGILLVATTPFPDLIHAFEHLRVPAILTTIVAFLYRYLFVLGDEVLRMLRARQARSAAVPGLRSGGSVWWRARVTGYMAGQLFLRSYERSERIYNAMLARGFSGQLRTLHPHLFTRRDWLISGVFLVILLMIQLLGWLR